jgi:hypothetical protein
MISQLMTGTAHEGGGIKVFKVNARYLKSGKVLLERDSIAPLVEVPHKGVPYS